MAYLNIPPLCTKAASSVLHDLLVFIFLRAYRIGQCRDVKVFRLISLGTVEEIMYLRQLYKQVNGLPFF
jgi:hypothetical protein